MSWVGVGEEQYSPKVGLYQKPELWKAQAGEPGLVAESRPWGTRGLGEHGGPRDGWAQTAWSRPGGLQSAARRIRPRPLSLPSGQATHGADGVGPERASTAVGASSPRASEGHARCWTARRRAAKRWGWSWAATRPAPSSSLYLGLQPRWRPGQAGAGTAEVRGRHVLLVQPVVGCLPHSQVTVGRR